MEDCNKPVDSKNPLQREFFQYEQEFNNTQSETNADPNSWTYQRNFTKFQEGVKEVKAAEAVELLNKKREIFQKKQKAKKCKPLVALAAGLLLQKLCRCPVCSPLNKVKDKVAGKNYFKIPFTNVRIPRFDHLLDKTVTFDQNRRKGEVCGACGGKKTIVDVNDDSAKYTQVSQMIDQKSSQIMEAEAKLGLGGTRTTIIQGSDLLFVGLGFNNNKTHEIIEEGAIAPSMKGGKIPQQNGTKVNAVVGKQGSLAWPQQVGNYTIKCANKFNLLAGAGGITIATPGPLTISAGLMKFVGPQLSIGSSTGPLTLEGDSINVTAKAVSITPTGGELFVKGNINNTGNITTQGHAHFESVSFTKGACVGTSKRTSAATGNTDNTTTQPATWSYKALASALLDLQNFYQNVLTDSRTSAFRLFSPKENINIADRLTSVAKLVFPYELLPTGHILPGRVIYLRQISYDDKTDLYGYVVATPIPLNNFPHVHGIPELMHTHDVTVPDMDYTSDTASALRGKMLNGAHESGVPSDPTKDTFSRLTEVARTAVEFTANIAAESIKLAAKVARLMG